MLKDGAETPAVCGSIVASLRRDDHQFPFVQVLEQSDTEVRNALLVVPAWEDLVIDREEEDDAEFDPNLSRCGWQQKVAECVDTQFAATNVWPILTNQEKALVRSQTGPLSSLPFTVLPTNRFTRFDPQPFRVLLLRQLHLPLLTARQCRCGRPLDACGHHRSACAVAGVLGRRGYPLETAQHHGERPGSSAWGTP